MYRKLFSASLLSLAAIMFLGCNESSKSPRVATKALYEVAANDKLIIHIDDDNQNVAPNGSEESPSGNGDATPGANQPPLASATANGKTMFVNVHVGEPVFFSSEGSHDPDGEIRHYIWTDMDNNVLSTDANFTRTFYEAAVYEKTLTLIDDHDASSYTRVCILADITAENISLIAQAGPDIVTNTNIPVLIEGHAVCKSGDFSYEWSEGDQILSTQQRLEHLFAEGVHDVTLKITDNATGQYALDHVTITVNPAPQPE